MPIILVTHARCASHVINRCVYILHLSFRGLWLICKVIRSFRETNYGAHICLRGAKGLSHYMCSDRIINFHYLAVRYSMLCVMLCVLSSMCEICFLLNVFWLRVRTVEIWFLKVTATSFLKCHQKYRRY